MQILKTFTCCVLLSALFAAAPPVSAETRYVSDQMLIGLRRVKENERDIIMNLKSDTPLEVLAEEPPYLKVRTEAGEVGYVPSRYVIAGKTKSMIISELEKEVGQLRERLATEGKEGARQPGAGDVVASSSATADLEKTLLATRAELQAITGNFNDLQEKSKRAMDIAAERDRLLEENSRLIAEMQQLSAEHSWYARTGLIKWFLAGASVFFVGWLVGKLARRPRGRL